MPAASDKPPTTFGSSSNFGADSVMVTGFASSAFTPPSSPGHDQVSLPLLGRKPVGRHQRMMWNLLWLSLVVMVGFSAVDAWQSNKLSLLAVVVVCVALLTLAVLGLTRIQRAMAQMQFDRSQRTNAHFEQQNREAEAQRLEARRINDANQAAILRLMNELQTVAEGDLTQQATVTEDITGAIADSVNTPWRSCAAWWTTCKPQR